MKTILAALCGLFVLSLPSPGQGAEITMGPALGLTHTRVSGAEVQSGDAVEDSGKLGFSARYRVIVGVAPRLALETGVGLLRQGARIVVTETDPDNATFRNTQTGEYRLTTLELPLRLRLRVTPATSRIGVVIFAGGALGARIGKDYDFANVEVNTGTGVATLTQGSDPLDDASGLITTAVFGLEVEKEIQSFLVSFSCGVHLGSGDTLDASAPAYQTYSVVAGSTSGLEFGLGIGARI